MVKLKDENIGRLVELELDKMERAKKGKIFGKIVSLQDNGVIIEEIPIPYEGKRHKREIPDENINKYRVLQSWNLLSKNN